MKWGFFTVTHTITSTMTQTSSHHFLSGIYKPLFYKLCYDKRLLFMSLYILVAFPIIYCNNCSFKSVMWKKLKCLNMTQSYFTIVSPEEGLPSSQGVFCWAWFKLAFNFIEELSFLSSLKLKIMQINSTLYTKQN